jgi:cyclin-dependent kinase regulatory subunit CKS1
MPRYPGEVEYSERYEDSLYEYRHVILPKLLAETMYRMSLGKRLLTEQEWRSLGVRQSLGWQHYEIHRPELHILLFRRPLGTDPTTGKAPDVPDIVLTIAVESRHLDGSADISCTLISGRQLPSTHADLTTSVSEYLLELETMLHALENQVKAVLACGKMLSDFPKSTPLLEILQNTGTEQ